MEVESYASTEAFAQAFRPRGRDCLILDQHLQGAKTGIEFLVSEAKSAINVPVILVTGRGDGSLRARALQAGAVGYLEKPVDETRLIAAIDAAVAAARRP